MKIRIFSLFLVVLMLSVCTQGDSQTAMISGWVWHDQCDSGKDGEPALASNPEGCVKDDSPLAYAMPMVSCIQTSLSSRVSW